MDIKNKAPIIIKIKPINIYNTPFNHYIILEMENATTMYIFI